MGRIKIPMVKLSLSHLPFMFSKDHFSQIKYNASSGNEGERFNVVFGLIGFDLWHIHLP